MTLWLPLLDYTQGYNSFVRGINAHIDKPGCVEVQGLGTSQIAALQWYGQLSLVGGGSLVRCTWLLVAPTTSGEVPPTVDSTVWNAKTLARHPAEAGDAVWLMQRR